MSFPSIPPEHLPPDSSFVKILGVTYLWVKLPNGDDFYLTQYGHPFFKHLVPDKWYNDFENKWEKQEGSGTVYKIKIKEEDGCPIDIVLKYSRVGQDVPGLDVDNLSDFGTAEFNSPFEEFSLVMEMRNTRYESAGTIYTHKPLGIYIPAERVHSDKLGRKEYKFEKKSRMQEIDLDLNRRYLVMYEWVKGIDAVEAAKRINMSDEELTHLMLMVDKDLHHKGFRDLDRKPRHIIVRLNKDGNFIKNKNGDMLYAYIDFEMLQRTPDREQRLKAFRRSDYLKRQRDRFNTYINHDIPPNLKMVNIFGLDYIYGKVQSTGGSLWVLGRDPVLFDYFLPERWRKTPRKKLSHSYPVYYTLTKDNIHIVWRVSRLGDKPDLYGFDGKGKQILGYGYNSPFEEFAIAHTLNAQNIHTIYPRAIYMTGQQTLAMDYMADNRRYESHKHILMPDGTFVLQKERNYITLWGHWNGPDELLAVRDGEFYSGINLALARRSGVISPKMSKTLLEKQMNRLKQAGITDLNFQPHHYLISLNSKGELVLDSDGLPELRISNMELLCKEGDETWNV
ncbi:MAG: hypothetical protein HQK83_02580 [Fibrobacteria bacterium]|nr:hypothetical protein [Fibrobacteria bacterium]